MISAITMVMIFAQAPTSTAVEPTEPTTVAGTLTIIGTEGPPLVRTAGGNTFVTLHSSWNVAGDLVGTFDCHPRAILFSTGESFVSEWGVYTVTFGDYEGTINARSHGWLSDDGLYHMKMTIVGGGTGELTNLRGGGSIDLNFNTGAAEYSFEVFWEE